MPEAPNPARTRRLRHVLDLLREQPLPADVLLAGLNRRLRRERAPAIQLRMLQNDLAWLRRRFPEAVEQAPRSALPPTSAFPGARRFWRLSAAEALLPVDADLAAVSELEALALHAARAVLAAPPPPGAHSGAGADEGPLAAALGRLIERLGLGSAAIPDLLGVNPGAPQPWDPRHALAALRAIRLGGGLRMRYRPLDKPEHEAVVLPVRVVLTDGEPYLWAWDGAAQRLKNYKLARVAAMAPHAAPPGAPPGLDAEVRAALRHAFRGVAGAAQRGRVVLRIAAGAVPHVRDRRLGPAQTWQDLPDGGARVAFNTHGLEAVRHWVLSFGARVQVEEPAALAAWVRAEARRMAGVDG